MLKFHIYRGLSPREVSRPDVFVGQTLLKQGRGILWRFRCFNGAFVVLKSTLTALYGRFDALSRMGRDADSGANRRPDPLAIKHARIFVGYANAACSINRRVLASYAYRGALPGAPLY